MHQGRGPYRYLIGDDRLSAALHALSEATNQQYHPLAPDYTYNAPDDPQHLYTRSDHYNFARHQVPVIFYASGPHADYPKPTDDVEKIDFRPWPGATSSSFARPRRWPTATPARRSTRRPRPLLTPRFTSFTLPPFLS